MTVAKDIQSLCLTGLYIRYCRSPRITERQYKALKIKENQISGENKRFQ